MTPLKLSAAQLDCLRRTDIDGRISRHVNIVTQGILEKAGLIEKRSRQMDLNERAELVRQREAAIYEAIEFLKGNSNNWRHALYRLHEAQGLENALNATCYWITAAGQEAIK